MPAPVTRARPGEPQWPDDATWAQLQQNVGGRLIRVQSPLTGCGAEPSNAECTDLFKRLKNPYFLGDEVGLTQTLGWVGAWTSRPSTYAVVAQTTEDVTAAVNFARQRNLRLVVKGGGHSYQGTSNSADSLLIWTHRMDATQLHDAFVGVGCDGRAAPQPAVTVEAGAIWGHVYEAVSTKAGRYVQGGGCLTVGVAGLVLGGGFGSFSKAFGTAAANLLQAEVITADGQVRIANACTNPDLFWALKGGGGSFGVVTRLTLRTHDLPRFFGAVFMAIRATSDEAFRRLIERLVAFYAESLLGPHWGEQMAFRRDNVASVSMVSQGLEQGQPEAVWRPFLTWLAERPNDFSLEAAPVILSVPARHFWDPEYLAKLPGVVLADDRPGVHPGDVFWAANLGEAAQVLHAYQSSWLSRSLLKEDRRSDLCDRLFAASRHHKVSLHFNKGLAGASAEVIEAARDTATHPAVLDAFALAICAAEEPPAYPGIPGHEPDLAAARRNADAVDKAMGEIRAGLPAAASYVSEGNYFEADWQRSFWGSNYARLLATKTSHDPQGLFFAHNGVGSEDWSNDGFVRATFPKSTNEKPVGPIDGKIP